jgi:superfamily II DNA/RNA helicase
LAIRALFNPKMTSFKDLGLSPEVLNAVAAAGYETPTPIQEQAIPVVLAGRDVLGIAQTGTGKTAGFTLPMIDKLAAGRSKARMPRSLVIEPTRELADQVSLAFEKYAKNHKLTWALLIGGVSFDDQLRKLDRGVDVLIATPGRLLDHFERGKLLLTGVQILVVDEADRMLDMGFIPDIERIFKMTPQKKQTLFFSATMPPEITRLTKQFLHDPVRIEASAPATAAETIVQHIARIPTSEPAAKRMALRALVGAADVKNGIVFCNRKSEVDVVAKSLKKHGFDAAAIHGDLDQSVRTRTLESFRKGDLKLLVASDVAARGLDIPDVSHVFNFDVPHHADDYVHRIGRTGRAGKSGQAFMIVTPADSRSYDKVLKLVGQTPDEVKLDLDWSSARSDDRRSSDRPPPRRSERAAGRDRPRPVTPHGERAAMTPVTPVAAAPAPAEAVKPLPEVLPAEPARAERGGRRERQERHQRPERRERPQPQAQRPEYGAAARPAESREQRPETPRRDHDGDDRGGRVVGFGADVPAFLTQATPKLQPAEAED